jgi:hypothetical protein
MKVIKKHETTKDEVVTNITELINTMLSYPTLRYHIIRTKTGDNQDITVKLIQQVLADLNKREEFEFVYYDLANTLSGIVHQLQQEPVKHTIIFIKEMLRCSQTLPKEYIGVLYERFNNNFIDDSTIIQGLTGRLCGYHNNTDAICFTNLDSVDKYEQLWSLKFDSDGSKHIRWYSRTTGRRKKNGITFNAELVDKRIVKEETEIITIIKGKTQEVILTEFVRLKMTGVFHRRRTGPKLLVTNDSGFFCHKYQGKDTVLTEEEVNASKFYKHKLSCNGYRYLPVYKDKLDRESVEFWFIYKHKTNNSNTKQSTAVYDTEKEDMNHIIDNSTSQDALETCDDEELEKKRSLALELLSKIYLEQKQRSDRKKIKTILEV